MVAGTHSGVGKTTWALALMALARRKGLSVQPFKAGPDYIDTGFHHQVCAPRKSRNLDLFLLSPEQVRECYGRNSSGADFSVTEGVMGLFDGRSATAQTGSSAELAKILNLPVLLTVDGSGMASSAAAVVLGFQKMDPDLKLAGILINRVNSERHFKWLKEAVETRTGVPCLGYLPKDPELSIPERHLGLTTAGEIPDAVKKVEKAVLFLEAHLDWERLLTTCKQSGARNSEPPFERANSGSKRVCRIGAAYDSAFSFYYEDNFDLLREAGAEIVFFSPMRDEKIPDGVSLLYFGGGFPEIHAEALSRNTVMIESIRAFHASGGLVYAECGGFIYLTESFIDSKDRKFPLAGLVPGMIRMAGKLQNFGYHELTALRDTFLFPKGTKLRSHEFHYSIWQDGRSDGAVYRIEERLEGFCAPGLVASYQHLHFGSNPELTGRLVRACEIFSTQSKKVNVS